MTNLVNVINPITQGTHTSNTNVRNNINNLYNQFYPFDFTVNPLHDDNMPCLINSINSTYILDTDLNQFCSNYSKYFSLIHVNTRSLNKNFQDLTNMFKLIDYNITAICSPRLYPHVVFGSAANNCLFVTFLPAGTHRSIYYYYYSHMMFGSVLNFFLIRACPRVRSAVFLTFLRGR